MGLATRPPKKSEIFDSLHLWFQPIDFGLVRNECSVGAGLLIGIQKLASEWKIDVVLTNMVVSEGSALMRIGTEHRTIMTLLDVACKDISGAASANLKGLCLDVPPTIGLVHFG